MSKSVRILEGYFQIEFYDHGKIYMYMTEKGISDRIIFNNFLIFKISLFKKKMI